MTQKFHSNQMWNHGGTLPSCVPGKRRANFSATTTCPWKLGRRLYWNTYRFQKEDAANETSCAPFRPGRSSRPFPSSKHRKYNKHGYENALTQLKGEDFRVHLGVPSPSKRRRLMATHQ